MAKICPLFSGSTGNSTLISGPDGGILIDAGVSAKRIKDKLLNLSCEFDKINAIAITHTHSDHISGLKVLLKSLKCPLIASKETISALEFSGVLENAKEVIEIADSPIELGGGVLYFFSTSHDSPGSGGYSYTFSSGKKITVCTDLGIVTDNVRKALVGSDILLLESNHDTEMLKHGPYPARLKLRILSDKGHLSNTACSAELPKLLESGTSRFILGHLSLHNNLPMLAYSSAKASLSDIGAKENEDYILSIAKPQDSQVITV